MRPEHFYDRTALRTRGYYNLKTDEDARTAKKVFKEEMVKRGVTVAMGRVERKQNTYKSSGGLSKTSHERWFEFNIIK